MGEKPSIPDSSLKGTLLNKSKLRGKLLEQQKEERETRFEDQTFIQRDSGKEWKVSKISPDTDRIQLKEVGGIGTLTLSLSDFKRKLETKGSPWRTKEE